MTVSRRIWLAGLVLALATCLVSQARAVDPKLLPGDTELVVSVNIKQMLNSEVAKQYKDIIDQARGALEAKIQDNPAVKFLEKTGFDVLRDLHGITLASNGTKDVDAMFVVVEGKFNQEKIHAAAEEFAGNNAEVLKISNLGATKIYEFTPPDNNKRFYAALINESTLLAAPSHDALKDAVSGTPRKAMKASFKSLLNTTSSKQSFSFAATGSAISRLMADAPIPNVDAAAGMLENVDGISMAVTIAKDIGLQLGINTKDAETAKQASGMLNFGVLGLRTAAANKAKEDPNLQFLVDVAKTVRVTTEGNNILLRGDITLENLEKLIKVLPKNFNR
jgi:hypothetical protein